MPHSNHKELPPLILQAALCAAPSTFLGFLAWFLFLGLQLFDVEARALLPIPVLCLLPFMTFYFSRTCARSGLIRPDASPLAVSVMIGAATALAIWLMPYLEELFPGGRSRHGKSDGGPTGFIMFAIVSAGGWIALKCFPQKTRP